MLQFKPAHSFDLPETPESEEKHEKTAVVSAKMTQQWDPNILGKYETSAHENGEKQMLVFVGWNETSQNRPIETGVR